MNRTTCLTTLVLAASALACGREPVLARRGDLTLTRAYGVPSTDGAGAAFVRVRNAGATADTLLAVTGPDSTARAALMTTTGGQMQAVSGMVVPAGGALDMTPGGRHVMFSDLGRQYAIGDTLHLVLRFAHAGMMDAAAPVLPLGETP
jgi:copper(I)-binding protein